MYLSGYWIGYGMTCGEDAVNRPLCLWLRTKFFVPFKVTSKSLFLN